MSVHGRIVPPEGHGEVLCEPPFETWPELVDANRAAARAWPEPLIALRAAARRGLLGFAREWTASLGVDPGAPAGDAPIVMTGHQPEIYHPGVWVKVFLLERLSRDIGATAIDLVVDTDRAGETGVRLPRTGPPVTTVTVALSPASEGAYAQMAVPGREDRERFRQQGSGILAMLSAPALRHHFGAFCDALDTAAERSSDLGHALTAARRAYEGPDNGRYLEASVAGISATPSYLAWSSSILLDATRFREVMNEALRSYRLRTGTRSVAQPFPDLEQRHGFVEAPFWLLRAGRRERVWVRDDGALCAGDDHVVVTTGVSEGDLVTLAAAGPTLAPRAIMLTLFARLFLSDLFIHGTGGGRYDRVTDAVISAYYGIEPPRFVVASMTLLLPLGAHVATENEVAELQQRLHRLEHNPDAMLDELEFDDEDECRRAHEIALRKQELVEAIKRPDADKKALGIEIRAANAALGTMLEPAVRETREHLERAHAAQEAANVLMDRTYPYCLWDPHEVADKVR